MELTGNMQRFYTHIYTHNSPCTHILTLSCMHTSINTCACCMLHKFLKPRTFLCCMSVCVFLCVFKNSSVNEACVFFLHSSRTTTDKERPPSNFFFSFRQFTTNKASSCDFSPLVTQRCANNAGKKRQWRRQTFFSAGAMGELCVLARVL